MSESGVSIRCRMRSQRRGVELGKLPHEASESLAGLVHRLLLLRRPDAEPFWLIRIRSRRVSVLE